MEKIIITVEGMSCEHCVKAVTGAVKALDGVAGAVVDLTGGTATVNYDARKISADEIKEAINEEGYVAK